MIPYIDRKQYFDEHTWAHVLACTPFTQEPKGIKP